VIDIDDQQKAVSKGEVEKLVREFEARKVKGSY
jgi:hypothetical protein